MGGEVLQLNERSHYQTRFVLNKYLSNLNVKRPIYIMRKLNIHFGGIKFFFKYIYRIRSKARYTFTNTTLNLNQS